MSELPPETAGAQGPEDEIPEWTVETLGDIDTAKIAIADDDGELPRPASLIEDALRRTRPINAAESKAEDAREARDKALSTGSHRVAIAATVQTLKALEVKRFNTSHVKDLGSTAISDPVASRRSGQKSRRFHRYYDRFTGSTRRSPEEQVDAESAIALRTIGQIANFEQRMQDDVAAADETGLATRLLDSHKPTALRHRITELATAGNIPESSPFHPRWSEAMDPKNVRQLRRFLIETSESVDTEQRHMAAYINGGGISGGIRPRVAAAYLGLSYEDWGKQGYGNQSLDDPQEATKVMVPKEVIDQINFLIKLAGYPLAKKTGPDGKAVTITALDKLIEYGAAKPWSEAHRDPSRKSFIDRIKEDKDIREDEELMNLLQAEQRDANQHKARPLVDQLTRVEIMLANLSQEDEDDPAVAGLRTRKKRLEREIRRLGFRIQNDEEKPGNGSK